MNHIIYGVLYGILGQALSFMQLQASIKFNWQEKYMWLILLVGVPNIWVYLQSVNHFIIAFNGSVWESRLLGFAIGVGVFVFMGWLMFSEPFTAKTGVSLLLALCIVLIQVLWR